MYDSCIRKESSNRFILIVLNPIVYFWMYETGFIVSVTGNGLSIYSSHLKLTIFF